MVSNQLKLETKRKLDIKAETQCEDSSGAGRVEGTHWVIQMETDATLTTKVEVEILWSTVAKPLESHHRIQRTPGPGFPSLSCLLPVLAFHEILTAILPHVTAPITPYFPGSRRGTASLLTSYRNKWEAEGTMREASPWASAGTLDSGPVFSASQWCLGGWWTELAKLIK